MRRFSSSRSIAVLAALGAAMLGMMPTSTGAEPETITDHFASTVIRDVNGVRLGTIRFHADGGKVTVSGQLTRLAAGFHGFHVHAVGICDPRATDPAGTVAPFLSAGPHLNPGGTGHGSHAGDLPVLYVAADGTTTTITATDRLSTALLFDADGSAVIVHGLPDNLAHIPTRYSAAGVPGPDAATLATGDAGGRVACGVVTRR